MIRVLVVDDSKFMARSLKSLLEGMNFEVVGLGHDGQEGLDMFALHQPDVTLLDVTMPNMCGVECLQQIKALSEDAKVVMHSALQDRATVDRCLEIGAVNFLQKPIRKNNPDDLARLKTTLQNAVEAST